ncbi:MAG TPA: hypothetical protein VGM38_02385 [Pseudolysinimonas sp.]|jgi:hypothetical protein
MPDNQAKPTTEQKLDAMESALSELITTVRGLVARKDSAKADESRDDESRDDAERDDARDDAARDDKAKKDAARDALFGKKDAKKDAKRDDESEDEDEDEKKESKGDESRDDEDEDEEEDKDKKGDAKKDESEPEPMASDDRRKDRKKDAARDDADRKDEDEDDDKARDDKRGDARADSATIRALKEQVARLERSIPRRTRVMTDDELNAISEKQSEWDRVAQMHGLRASRPLDGERINSYDRRMAKQFQKHSAKWKDADLSAMPIEVVASVISPEIRTDSISAAYRVEPSEGGMQREVRRQDRTGRWISEFVGPVNAVNGALAPFRMAPMRVLGINTNPNRF